MRRESGGLEGVGWWLVEDGGVGEKRVRNGWRKEDVQVDRMVVRVT